MPRDYRLYLEDMRDAILKIQAYSQAVSFDQLKNSPMLVDAVLHNLEIIGEAAKHIPEEMRAEHAAVEWRKIIGLRDILAHEYFSISLDIVWDLMQNKLPELLAEIQNILESTPGGDAPTSPP